MDLHYLWLFYNVAEHLSFSKAAQELHLSQPTISMQIKKFESQLGITLFDRFGRNIYLSRDGQLVFEYAKKIFDIVEELKEEMTILFSTHILTDADEISDELLLLHEGEIVEEGSIKMLREKYQTAAIELVFTHNTAFYRDKILSLSSITNCYTEREAVHITASDISAARQEILKAAAEENWPLTSFTLHRASLEDMFMKAVNQ